MLFMMQRLLMPPLKTNQSPRFPHEPRGALLFVVLLCSGLAVLGTFRSQSVIQQRAHFLVSVCIGQIQRGAFLLIEGLRIRSGRQQEADTVSVPTSSGLYHWRLPI